LDKLSQRRTSGKHDIPYIDSTTVTRRIYHLKTTLALQETARPQSLIQHDRDARTEPSDLPTWTCDLPDDEEDREGEPRDSKWVAKVQEYLALPDDPEYDVSQDEAEDDELKNGTWINNDDIGLYRAVEWKFHRMRSTIHPEPGDAYSYDEWKAGKSTKKHSGNWGHAESNLRHTYHQINLEKEFRDQGLQVIVKLASVELTPEKPEYGGGNWHLEVSREPSKALPNKSTTNMPDH
jgi:hypothetical protein